MLDFSITHLDKIKKYFPCKFGFAEFIDDLCIIYEIKVLIDLCFIYRVQDLRELGELSPHWDNLRKEVMTRYGGIISTYQETLAELDKITGKTEHTSKCFISTCAHIHIHAHTHRGVLVKLLPKQIVPMFGVSLLP